MGIILIFIDGLGLGLDDPEINPLLTADLSNIQNLLQVGPTQKAVGPGIIRPNWIIKAIDARLGVSGLPQSATGQTTLFTGVNAPKITGRHINAFLLRHYGMFWRDSVFSNRSTKLEREGYSPILSLKNTLKVSGGGVGVIRPVLRRLWRETAVC